MIVAARRRGEALSPIGAFAAVVVAGLLVIERNLAVTDDWVATHYLFSYQDGLYKRALVGSVLRLITRDAILTIELVTALGLLLLLAFVLLAALLTAAAIGRDREHATTALLLGVLVVASTHTRTLIIDVGRFDVLLLVLLIVIALLSAWDARAGLVALPPLLIASMLVHEISLVATAPLMTLMVLHRLRSLDRPRPWLLAGVGAATLSATIAVAFLATAGRTRDAAEAAMLAAAQRAGFAPTRDAIMIQSSSTLENVQLALGRLISVGPLAVLILLAVALPALVLAREATFVAGPSRSATVLGVAALSPLALMLVGTDYGRWTMLAVLNVLVLALWWRIAQRRGAPTRAERLPPTLDLRRPGIFILTMLALLLPSPSRIGLGFPGVMTSNGTAFRTSARELLRLLAG